MTQQRFSGAAARKKFRSRYMHFPIIDLHCDLLLYLTSMTGRTPYDPAPGCSLSQLKEGGVKTQIFALFTETRKGSVEAAQNQLKAFLSLRGNPEAINPILAIENLSCFFEEDEPLSKGVERLEKLTEEGPPIGYASLTWNEENRFGGGTYAGKAGLKSDGRSILELLSELKIPVDLSHASDLLAEDILTEIDRQSLKLPVLASHSNSRAVCPQPRNLPDSIATEIFYRGGIIGLNFVIGFVGGENPRDIVRHYHHFASLGGKDQICFGADYFFAQDLPDEEKAHKRYFSPRWENASCYQALLNEWLETREITLDEAAEIAYKNARRFYLENTQITHI